MSPRPHALTRPEVEERADTTIGPYRILHLLGEGTIGRVYLAEHERLGRKVAIKVLKRRFATNPAVVRRFFGEAKAMNRIRHDNVVEVTDFIETTDGKSCYVMELLTGCSLADLIADREPIPVDRIIDVARQLASALSAVHSHGVVHRDLKPDNVFLTTRNGRPDFVKVIDFGVAKLTSFDDDSLRHRTLLGALIGTPEYMSPEQTLGVEVEASADVYGFGVVLYELLSGRRPFGGDTVKEVLEAQRGRRPPRLDEPPVRAAKGLADLVDRCLSKDPSARPSIADAGRILETIAMTHRPSRRPLFLGAATLAFGVAVFGAAAWKRLVYEPSEEPAIVMDEPVVIEPEVRPEPQAIAEVSPPPPPVDRAPTKDVERPPVRATPKPARRRPQTIEKRTGPIDRSEILDPFAEAP